MFSMFGRFIVVAGVLSWATADAQHYHRHNHNHHNHYNSAHHHHDAMGHRIDDRGHHIDLYGRHTGAVGVYDNGSASYPRYGGYWSNGLSIYGTAPITAVAPVTVLPRTVSLPPANQSYVNPPPQNILPVNVGSIVGNGGKIVIRNPADSGGHVRYHLNGFEYTINPGSSQTIDTDRVWVITFGSGGSRGDVQYTLSQGTFQFKATQAGWDLQRTTEPAIAQNNIPPAPSPAPIPDQLLNVPALNP